MTFIDKIRIIIQILMIFIFICLLNGCDRHVGKFQYVNNSENDVMFRNFSEIRPMGTLVDMNPQDISAGKTLNHYVNVEKHNALTLYRTHYEGYVGNFSEYCYNDTLYIVILSPYVVNNFTEKEVVERKMILCEYRIASDQLNRFLVKDDFLSITYPPFPDMQDIWMWPPYEEIVK